MDRQKIFNLALKVFLFLSPVFFFRQYQLSFARGMFFILGTFALFAISLSCEPKRKFSNIWVSLFLLFAFIRMFFDNNGVEGEWFNFWMVCAEFIYVFCGVLLFYIVYCYADIKENYFKPIIAVCVINAILVSAQLADKDFIWTNAPSICGFMETSSQLGQYSALALPLFFHLNPWYILIPAFTLFASKSISPILAGVIGMAFLGGFKGRILKIKAGVGVLLVLLGLLNFGYIRGKFQCRPITWQKTLKVALQRPYLGWGYGSFREKVTGNIAIDSLGKIEFKRAHNDYLHTAQEMGFPIMICAVIFFVVLFKKFKLAVKYKSTICLETSIIIVLINMSGQTLIRYASIAGTFIILLALFYAEVDNAGSL